MHIPDNRFDEIAREITSDDSPVGIDARKTHVIIIHMLNEIQARLDRLEERMTRLEERQ